MTSAEKNKADVQVLAVFASSCLEHLAPLSAAVHRGAVDIFAFTGACSTGMLGEDGLFETLLDQPMDFARTLLPLAQTMEAARDTTRAETRERARMLVPAIRAAITRLDPQDYFSGQSDAEWSNAVDAVAKETLIAFDHLNGGGGSPETSDRAA